MELRVKDYYIKECCFKLIISIFILLLSFGCNTTKEKTTYSIGGEGNITSIIVPESPCLVSLFAAEELNEYFEKITGTRLQLLKAEPSNVNLKAIRFNLAENPELNWDGYSIETDKKGITITSKEPRGLLYGAYQILEDAGCSFVYMGENEEVVPQLENMEFLRGIRIFNPSLEHRGIAPYGLQASSVELGRDFIDWMAKNKLNYILVSEDRPSDSPGSAHGSVWKEVSHELLPELQKRGSIIEMSEHCTHVFFPRSLFEEHPDWFALNDGERKLGEPPYSGQMCYSNQDAVEYYANAVAEYAATHPEFQTIGTWPLDGGEYCECKGCEDPFTVFKAAMHVAEKVKEARPDIIVEHLAYQPKTWQPPAMEQIPDNMSVLWCLDNGKLDSLAKEWIQKSSGAQGVYQFEYFMGDNYRSRANVWLRPEFAINNVRHAQEMGFRGIISLFLPMGIWWRSCFNYWFFAKACWDPQLDVNAYLKEYCRKYYNEYANEVEGIFNRMFIDMQPEPYTDVSDLPYKDKLGTIISTTADLATQIDTLIQGTDNSTLIERLNRLKAYVEFFGLYYESCSEGTLEALTPILNYSNNHPEYNMVLMPPDYIQWMHREIFN